MHLRRPAARLAARLPARTAAAAGCAAVLAVGVPACSGGQQQTARTQVRDAVAKIGEKPKATVMASVEGSPGQARAFLRATTGQAVSQQEAELFSRAELTTSVHSGDREVPLGEMARSEPLDTAVALNFGGKDIAEVKTVAGKLYLRAALSELTRQAGGSQQAQEDVRALGDSADALPKSLTAARDAIQERWVTVDPGAFEEFAKAGEAMSDEGTAGDGGTGRLSRESLLAAGAAHSGIWRQAAAAGSALEDGQWQRQLATALERTLGGRARYAPAGHKHGAQQFTARLPARQAARQLGPSLKALGAEVDPSSVPEDRDLTAQLDVRRGQLTTVTMDLAQLTERGSGHLPLRLEVGGGAALEVESPGEGAKKLTPQDLLSALVYGAVGRTDE